MEAVQTVVRLVARTVVEMVVALVAMKAFERAALWAVCLVVYSAEMRAGSTGPLMVARWVAESAQLMAAHWAGQLVPLLAAQMDGKEVVC